MSEERPIIVWLRQDLRLRDNPALYHAAYNKTPILPIFIYDPKAMDRDFGAAQKWWLHHALKSLRKDFKDQGVDFIVRQGDTASILKDLIKQTDASGVYWNRFYEKWQIERDTNIKDDLRSMDLDVHSFKASVLNEPWDVESGSGGFYKVFTPYYKKCLADHGDIDDPLPIPNSMINASHTLNIGDIDDFNFMPDIPWYKDMGQQWDISEDGAWSRLNSFFKNGLSEYKDGRDIPSIDKTSKMSPYLRWGIISPRSICHATNEYTSKHDNVPQKQSESFIREVYWREFTHHLLYYFPDMKDKPLQEKFIDFPWDENKDYIEKWQSGQIGYPIVDAGMRQLWQTGWMHNRVRMIVGSLLVKHLLQSWQHGEEWFWDTLVDACPANNTAGWQWIGGCGADAAPYFRIFNPMTQGEKFDAYAYVRHYVPELKDVSDKYLFEPWDSPNPPKDYPAPIIGHKEGRERALSAFEKIKN